MAEGVDVSVMVRYTGHAESTISRWLERMGSHSILLHNRYFHGLVLTFVQLDELQISPSPDAAENEIELMTVHTATLKKFATGKGNAGKKEMIAAARARGWAPADDNMADALTELTEWDAPPDRDALVSELAEFIDRHAILPITKDLQLPTVVLKMSDAEDKRCSFVTEKGCGVYEDRPWSCRMYPVAMALPPARVGVEPKPQYFLLEDDFCKGHDEPKKWTVDEWREDQDLMAREELEAGFREIVSHPWFIGGTRKLDAKRMEMFFTACYDLDKFRTFVFESTFLERFDLEPGLADKLREDDEELLRFAFRWLKLALFGEPVLKVKDSARRSA